MEKLPPLESQELDFSDIIDLKRHGFVGRDWLFNQINHWRFESDQTTLLLVGRPGTGKSSSLALLSHLNHRRQIIAHHFCQRDRPESIEPSLFARSITAMLKKNLPTSSLHIDPPPSADGSHPPIDILRSHLLPLKSSAKPAGGSKLILIDDLDASLNHPGTPSIVDLIPNLSNLLPSWIKLIVSLRTDSTAHKALHSCQKISISLSDPQNLADIDSFLKTHLQATTPTVNEQSRFKRLSTETAGSFLCAVAAVDSLRTHKTLPIKHPWDSPTLNSAYSELAQDLTGPFEASPERPSRSCVLTTLLTLALAKEPLSVAELSAALYPIPPHDLPSILAKITAVTRRSKRSDRSECLSLFHHSFAHWLLHSPSINPFPSSISQASKGILRFCETSLRDDGLHLPVYVRRNALKHFIECEAWDLATTALSNLEFIHSRIANGEYNDLLADYSAAEQAFPESQTPFQRQQALGEEWTRYARALSEHASDPTAPAPVAPSCHPLRTDDPTGRERPSKDVALNRFQIIRQFRTFLASSRHLLRTFVHPAYTYQLAFNSFTSGPVREAAERFINHPAPISLIWSLQAGHFPQLRYISGIVGEREKVIRQIAISAEGRLIATCHAHCVRIWDRETVEVVHSFEDPTHNASHIAITPDGKRCVSAGTYRSMALWDLETGTCLGSRDPENTVLSLHISADGTRAVLGSPNGIDIIDLTSMWQERRLEATVYNQFLFALSSDGRIGVHVRESTIIVVHNLDTGDVLKEIQADQIAAIAMTPDARRIVSVYRDITVWDVDSGECIRKINDPKGVFKASVAISANGTRVMAGGEDLISVWDITIGECIREYHLDFNDPDSMFMSADGRFVIFSDYEAVCYILDITIEPSIHCRSVFNFDQSAMTPDGRRFICGSKWNHQIEVWDTETGLYLHDLCGFSGIGSAFTTHPCACDLVVVGSGSKSKGGTFSVYNVETGTLRLQLGAPNWFFNYTAISEDGRLYVARETIKSFDLETGDLIDSVDLLQNAAWSDGQATMSPEGRMFVFLGKEYQVHVWNLNQRTIVSSFGSLSSRVTLSPDQRLVAHLTPGYIQLTEIETGEVHTSIESEGWSPLVFTPDGRYLIYHSSCELVVHSVEQRKAVWSTVLHDKPKAICLTKNQMVLVTRKQIMRARHLNLIAGPIIATATRMIATDGSLSATASAVPWCCRSPIHIPESICQRVEAWEQGIDDEGYADTALTMDCPNCATRLKINPFFNFRHARVSRSS